MKKSTFTLVLFLSLISFISCEKDPILVEDPTDSKIVKTYELEIKVNNSPLNTFTYNEQGVIQELVYNDGLLLFRIEYKKDSINDIIIKNYYTNSDELKKVDSIYLDNGLVNYTDSYTKASLGWTNYNVYHIYKYDNNNRLTTYSQYDSLNNHNLIYTYEYDNNNNIIYEYYPLETGLSQDSIFYDNSTSAYSVLNLPMIDNRSVSNHNIVKLKRLNDNSAQNASYTSIFKYNTNNYPTEEVRTYSNKVDTITYNIKEVTTHANPHGSKSARFFILSRLYSFLSADRTQTTNYCHEGLAWERYAQANSLQMTKSNYFLIFRQ